MYKNEDLVFAGMFQDLAVEDVVHDLVTLDGFLLVDADVGLRQWNWPEAASP